MLRRTIIILIVFAVLLGAAALAVHLVLQSEWLGETALARISEQLGMDVGAESFDVGWGGETVIRGLTVTMPLTDETILSADSVELGHAMIPLLILGRPIDLRSVEVESPRVNLRRYESGRWNVQDAWAYISASLGETERDVQRPSLPRVVVHDGLIHIAGPNDTMETLGPVRFEAQPEGPLLWTFDLSLPSLVQAEGRLVQGRAWAHEAGFTVEGVGPLLKQLARRDLSPISVAGHWEGSLRGDRLDGRVRFTRAVVGRADLQGDMQVEASADAVTLQPQALVLTEPNLMGREIHLASGTIRITATEITAAQLTAEIGAATGRLDGRWDLQAQAGQLSGSWTAVPAPGSRYHGTYEGTVKSPQLGRMEAEATLTASADTEAGRSRIVARIQGAGPDWQKSDWQILLPRLAWSLDERQVDMAGAAAQIDVNWPQIRLVSMHLPNARNTSGSAAFHATTRQWSAHLETGDLRLPGLGIDDLDARLVAQGNLHEALVSELRVATGARILTGRGELSFAERGFHDVSITADWPVGEVDPGQPQAVQPIGRWHLGASVTGRIRPLAVGVEGKLTGQNIAIGKQTVPRVVIPLHADVDPEHIQVATRPFSLLSGSWQATGRHDLATGSTQINMVIDDISLTAVAGIAGAPLESRGSAQAKLQLVMPGLGIQEAVATGRWSAKDVNIPPLQVHTAGGVLRVSDGLVRLEDIELEQEGGYAHASVEFQLDRPQDVAVEFRTESWPVRFPAYDLAIFADSRADLQMDVVTRGVQGRVQLSAGVLLREKNLARVRVAARMHGQVLLVQSLYAEMLDGFVEGVAEIPLDRWVDSTAQMQWRGIQPGQLERWAPQFEQFEGMISGSLAVEQADRTERPPEPMRLVLDAHVADGRFGPAQIGVGRIVGYLGPTRLLIDEAIFDVLGGRLDVRGRVSRHIDNYYASVAADFNDLNLNQLVHVIDPNAAEYVGLLSGRASILSSSDRRDLGGEALISLTQSDLVNNSVVRALHGVLNLQLGEQQPTGTGEVKVRLEGPSVIIPSFMYFNRGVDIRGAGEIEDVYLGADSPVNGYAVGSTRVLKGISLPGVAELDRLLATFQMSAASVRIDGTIDDVEVNVVPLPAVLGSFRRLLWSQLRE